MCQNESIDRGEGPQKQHGGVSLRYRVRNRPYIDVVQIPAQDWKSFKILEPVLSEKQSCENL